MNDTDRLLHEVTEAAAAVITTAARITYALTAEDEAIAREQLPHRKRGPLARLLLGDDGARYRRERLSDAAMRADIEVLEALESLNRRVRTLRAAVPSTGGPAADSANALALHLTALVYDLSIAAQNRRVDGSADLRRVMRDGLDRALTLRDDAVRNLLMKKGPTGE